PKAARPESKKPSYLDAVKGDRARDPAVEQKISIKAQIHKELHERLNIKRLTASHVGESELHQKVQSTIQSIIADISARLPPGFDPATLAKEIYDEAVGLGPLETLLARDDITEIMVNGPDRVYIEQAGKLILTDQTFMNDQSVHAIIERIVAPIGRRIDESQPYVDARLPDGSRVNAIIHPLSLIGPCLTIRKFSKEPLTVDDLIGFGSMTEDAAEFIRACVILRKNIIVSGGTGTGKTTLLNVISSYLPEDERIVTIEDAAELRLTQDHVIRLEARPPNMEGKGAITIRDLVRNALRMRPDRIVVGECRGGEALDMLQAMNTGHEGSLTTIHANTPRDVISRLETMVLMTGMDFPLRAIREQVGAAIDMIVQIGRYSDGARKVDRITEIVGLEGDKITMQDLFMFKQTGIDSKGKVEGRFMPTGSVPTFMEQIKVRGIAFNHRIFDPDATAYQS
ncbi:MAG: CpaF family protein, partial [Verrucomicrobiota bacterium]